MTTALRGNSLYAIVYGPSWTQAEASAVALGGHLATISSASENQFLVSTYPNQPAWYMYWIGLNDASQEGVYTWTSGETVTYTNWRSGSGPNRSGSDTSSIGPSYIEFQVNNLNESSAGQWNDVANNAAHPDGGPGIAEIPLALSFTRSGTPTEGAGLFTTSINLSAGNTSNLANGTTVYWTVSGVTSDDLASGSLTGSGAISGGKLDLQHSLVSDADSGENFQVSAYSDSARTLQIGTTSSIAIQEAPSPVSGGGSSSSTTTTTPAATPANASTTPTTTPAATPAASVTPTPSAESPALGIPPQASVQTVQLSTPVTFGSLAVSQAVVGTKQNDSIIGSDAAEALTGGLGRDQIIGGKGPDAFVFETAGEFGKRNYDTIKDFNPAEGDKVVISAESFTGITRIAFQSVNGKKAVKAASKGKNNLIYDSKSGMLYFDSNGKKNGWGDGGEFAKLLGSPEISKSDFVIV